MANYCNNTLSLNDKTRDSILKVLEDYMQNGRLAFEKVRPIPTALKKVDKNNTELCKKLIRKYGAANWGDWCIANWGTNSGCQIDSIGPESICFTTNWSPPIGIVKTLSMLTGREFRLAYIEEGMDYCGEYFSYPDWLQNDTREYSPISSAPKKLQRELCSKSW